MDKNISFNIIHSQWIDLMYFDEEQIFIIRESNNNEKGKILLKDNILIIYWENWPKEYFFKIDSDSQPEINYYELCPKFIYEFNFLIDIVYLITNSWNETCIIDIKNKKIYKKESLEIGLLKTNNIEECENNNFNFLNIFWIDYGVDEIFILFNNKYYNYYFFLNTYEIVSINIKNNDKIIFLDKKTNIFYHNNNLLNNGIYYKYKNCLSLDNILYFTPNKENNNLKFYFKFNLGEKILLFNNFGKYFMKKLDCDSMFNNENQEQSFFRDQNNNYTLINNYNFSSSIINDKLEIFENILIDNNNSENKIFKSLFFYIDDNSILNLLIDKETNLFNNDNNNNFFSESIIIDENQITILKINKTFYKYDKSNNNYYENISTFLKNKESKLEKNRDLTIFYSDFSSSNNNINIFLNYVEYINDNNYFILDSI